LILIIVKPKVPGPQGPGDGKKGAGGNISGLSPYLHHPMPVKKISSFTSTWKKWKK
jgi:hypothetical protein